MKNIKNQNQSFNYSKKLFFSVSITGFFHLLAMFSGFASQFHLPISTSMMLSSTLPMITAIL